MAGAPPVSHVAMLLSFRIVAARLNGSLDFFSLETRTAFSPLQFRGQRGWARRVPTPGAGVPLRDPSLGPVSPGQGSSPTTPVYSSSDTVCCRLTHTVPCAHQKPITALKAAAGRLVTGSQDHTLRVSVRPGSRVSCGGGGGVPRPECGLAEWRPERDARPCPRCSVWRTPAASSPCRATRGPSRPCTWTR